MPPELTEAPVTALRYNAGKPDYTLMDFKSMLPMIKVLDYGAKKYTVKITGQGEVSGRENWKLPMAPKEILKSMLRHVAALSDGEELDPESGLPHIGHIMCNAMFYSYHSNLNE